MNIHLIKATASDAEALQNMQIECFMPHFERYQDVATSPVNESLEKMRFRINDENGCYFKVMVDAFMRGVYGFLKKRKTSTALE